MEFNRAQLKRSVKLSMKSTIPRPMLVALLFGIVVSAGTWLINTVLGWLLTGDIGSISNTVLRYLQEGYELDNAVYIAMLELFRRGPGAMFSAIVGGTVLSILVTLWQSSMNVGYEGWCLSMVRNENPRMDKIFGALPMFGQVLITRFLTGLFIYLWLLLLCVGLFALLFAAMALAAAIGSDVLMVLLVLAVFAVFWVCGVWVTMRYALVDYLLLDKGLSGMEAIRESKRLMRGNVSKGFMLQLSFVGWYLLEIAVVYAGLIAAVMIIISADSTNGLIAASGMALVIVAAMVIVVAVLSLWLKPYVTGSMARFYDWTQGRMDGFDGSPGWSGGSHGWGEPQNYTWTTGPNSGTGTGSGPAFGGGSGSDNGGSRSPKPPRDDPWN